ncbi:MAG: spore germination protein [Clostridia bacterium]|nr:spore germination protein [Clostridia bacterium]
MEENKISNLNSSDDIINYIKDSTFNSQDIVYKELIIQDEKIHIVYDEPMVDTTTISDFVIRSIKNSVNEKIFENIDNKIENFEEENNNTKISLENKIEQKLKKLNKNTSKEIEQIVTNLEKIITIGKIKKLDLTQDDIFYYLFSGFTCVIYHTIIYAVNTRGNIDRSISEPTSEKNIKGPKDAFTENYQNNIGLIRKRIKSEKLVLEESKVGRRSKTKIGIMYIEDIARPNLVEYIKEKLKKINIDAILDSNYIMEILEDSDKTDFPTMISTERPDLVSNMLLQGRLALIVENSPFVLIIPAFITDFINNVEDYYQKNVNLFITKIIRYIAFFITIFTPAIYVALTTFDQETIPTQLLLSFTTQREGVPFPAFLEAFIMIVSFELLREGDFRIPNTGGSTLSIVGALILGDAAVNAGIVSPIMIIVIAITTISGLMFTDINMANALRTWRFILLIFASMAGLVGVAVGLFLLIIKLASTTSATKPYTYPIAPINLNSIMKNLFKRKNISNDTKRQKILTNNLTKYVKIKEQAK